MRTNPYTVTLVLAASLAPTAAGQILLVHDDSITEVLFGSATRVQDVRPIHLQRGVVIDGTLRSAPALPWALQGNPFETPAAGESLESVRLSTGAYAPFEIDLSLPAQVPWVIGRTYNARQRTSGDAHHDSDGYQGRNWFQMSQPELVFFDADDNSQTKEAEDLVYIVYGADRFLEFKRTDDDEDTFRGVNGAAGVIEHEVGSPDLFVYYDQRGNRTYFFGGNTSNGRADWQLWKFVDPAGNTAYVGHETTISTAISNGYDASGRILEAFDSAGRRYCYTYSPIDGVTRLTQVIAETDAGGGWGDCGEETLVGKVEYDYYTNDSDHGDDGNLELVTIHTPLTVSTDMLVRRQYYRYWKGTFNADTNPGHPDAIKLVLDHEGVRRADWDADGELDENFRTDIDVDLMPYASAYLEYDASRRIAEVFFNGECGCGGGTNGAHALTYQDNPNFSGTSGYDTSWLSRVVIEPPSGAAWVTQYFDETGQALSRVLTDIDPASEDPAPEMWVTQVVRNSAGQVTEVHTPANVTAYDHDDTGNPDGSITTSGTAGLVHFYERVSSGSAEGFLQGVRQKAGSNDLATNSTYITWTAYTIRDLEVASGVNVSRPLVSTTRAFHTATTDSGASANYDETTRSLTWWEPSTDTNVLYITLKQVTTNAPAVSSGKNGSGSATSTKRYLRKDGTTAFTESARGIVGYTGYTAGQVTKRIEDAKTDTGTSYPSGEHPNTDFGIASSTAGHHRVTGYLYDDQGRLSKTDLPSGRTTLLWYTMLADMRPVTYSIPKVASYDGPAGYTVSNQAGNTEDCMVIAITGGSTNTDPSGWHLDVESGSPPVDPVEVFDQASIGPIARLTSSVYDTTGTRLVERRVYSEIPGSPDYLPGTEGTHYDAWRFGYDAAGRLTRVKEPSGTITRTDHDVLGRVTARRVGTNDTGEPGGEPSGTNDMVTVDAMVYDGGSDGGNSLLTETTGYVEDGTTGQRVTSFVHDYRGRLIVTVGPQAPYAVNKFDNLGRLLATGLYGSSGGLSASTDPTTTSTNRVGLTQAFYDERGQVWKSQRHKITQSTGADADNLQTLNWYDPDGRLIKTDGAQLVKTRYDRLGRSFQVFVLATDDDTSYSDVYDSTNKYAAVGGDKVLEERQTGYDPGTDRVLVDGVIAREHGDTSTTGPLDTTYDGGDGLPLKFTAANVLGRIQITAYWYDDLERPTTTAFYGTNDATDNVGTFDRDGLTEPSASDSTKIVTKTVYADDGSVLESVDALERVTHFEYDAAGRLVTTIANYTEEATPITNEVRDYDIYTRYVYENGLQTKIWVDLDGDNTVDAGDQVTEYVYGTPKGTPGSGTPVQSAIGTGHLLREVIYPEQVSQQSAADRTVNYAYNAQGELVWQRDQEGNISQTDYDTAGRETHRRVTNVASGFDDAVLRISTTYLARGLVDKVTQYDHATAGSGDVVDDLRFTYDDWGNISAFIQDVDSDLDDTPAGRDSFQLSHTYAKATTGRNTIRRSQTTLPGSRLASYVYQSAGGRLDDAASRVTRISVGVGIVLTPAVDYEYLGLDRVAGTDLLQPDARWNLFEGATGSNPYPDLDRFNRVTSSRWTGYKGTGTRDFYDVDVAYDEASNITSVIDNVHKTSGGNRNFDVLYTLDDLSRLTRADEGTLSGGSISNRSRDERWLDASGDLALSQTGNWLRRRLDLSGDGSFTGTGELDETNTFNLVNELLARDLDSDTNDDETLVYDKAGHLTDDGRHYTYEYDAFGRLRRVVNRDTDDLVAEYRYNGLGFRTGWHSDVTDDGTTGDPDGVVDGDDPWFWFCYDESWRIVAVFRAEDEDPKEVYVHHNAGLDGYGGSSYIDAVVLRDRDANTAWHDEADGTLEERVYYCQNWRADVSAILTATGKMVEWVKHSAYGVPYALPAGDTDSDGDWDANDAAAIIGGGAYDVRKDAELDGDVDSNDAVYAHSITGAYQTLGRGVLSSAAVNNRRGYAGYEFDPTFEGAERWLYHVRHRVYDAEVGRWTRRDPLGYVDGMSLYEYVRSMPIITVDPDGRLIVQAVCCVACGVLGILDLINDITSQACVGCSDWMSCLICWIGKVTGLDTLACILDAMRQKGTQKKLDGIRDCLSGFDAVISLSKLAACACCIVTTAPQVIPRIIDQLRPRVPWQPTFGGTVAGFTASSGSVGGGLSSSNNNTPGACPTPPNVPSVDSKKYCLEYPGLLCGEFVPPEALD